MTLPLFALAAGALALLAAIALIIYRSRTAPSERERRRRHRIALLGRTGDAMLTDTHGDLIYYSYSVNGVPYSNAQDLGALRSLIPADANLMIGPISHKYLPRDPGNSVVVCETWSGLRLRPKTAADPVDSAPSHSA